MFEFFAPDTNRENPFGPQPYDGAKRLKKAHTAIAEKGRSARRFKSHRPKHQRNSSRRANVINRNLGRHGDAPGSIPRGMAFHSLNEEIAFTGVIVGRGNSQCVEVATPDIVLDSVARDVSLKIVPQRRCV